MVSFCIPNFDNIPNKIVKLNTYIIKYFNFIKKNILKAVIL